MNYFSIFLKLFVCFILITNSKTEIKNFKNNILQTRFSHKQGDTYDYLSFSYTDLSFKKFIKAFKIFHLFGISLFLLLSSNQVFSNFFFLIVGFDLLFDILIIKLFARKGFLVKVNC